MTKMVLVLAAASALGCAAAPVSDSFDSDATGALPPGWRAETTNPEGPNATWKVAAGPDARSRPNVLSIAAVNHDSTRCFNVCWTDAIRFRDGAVEVSFRALDGKIDRGGGPMWRVRDAANYYVCRANPLERNFRVYSVKDGKRTQLATADVSIPSNEWQTIRIEHRGDRIACWLEGKKLLEAQDASLPEEGGVGVWTKADAVTSFDDLLVTRWPTPASKSR
jgi:Domain of Unknown Function (DUF1080)